ncbi:MAG: cyclic nucleotide-binding domain-containing protein [Magnetococcales bacterium]|nr:cyclic nucleotide-binding domain-containing protein [Magnetococcales bacterium]
MPESDFNPAQVRQLLDRSAFFRELKPAEKDRLARLDGALRRYDTGEVFLQTDAPAREFLLLLSGEAAVVRGDRPPGCLLSGNLLGEEAFFAGGEQDIRITAATSSLAFAFDRAALEELGADIREKIKDAVALKLFERLAAQNARMAESRGTAVRIPEQTKTRMRLKIDPQELTPSHILQLIGKLSFFDAFSKYEKRRLAAVGACIKLFQGGEAIVREGGTDRSFYILLDGCATVSVKRNATMLNILQTGDFFGEVTFFSGRPRTTTVHADGPVVAVEVGEALFSGLGVAIRERFKDAVLAGLIRRLEQQQRDLAKLR